MTVSANRRGHSVSKLTQVFKHLGRCSPDTEPKALVQHTLRCSGIRLSVDMCPFHCRYLYAMLQATARYAHVCISVASRGLLTHADDHASLSRCISMKSVQLCDYGYVFTLAGSPHDTVQLWLRVPAPSQHRINIGFSILDYIKARPMP